ncbi:myosin-15-like isoform X11 [Acropora muricata]|uniref:myosin-15-like isoform X9 n=1 Tax=Acropora muricata TaxID=159855 RepID=UPI0034E481F6
MASSNQFGWDRKYVLKEADFHETNLADEIGVRWKDLARALGFSQASIEIIAKENINSVKECCIAVLVSWLRREGEGAITEKLVEALVRIRLTNVAERFTCKPSDQSQNSEAVTVIRNLEMELVKTVSARTMELEAEVDKMSARNKKLEDEVDKMSARNKKLEDENSRQSARIKELEATIQKNNAVWETVTAAVQEIEKNPEQRREENLNRINSEVQELQQQLKRVKLDMVFTDECMVSSVDRKNTPKDKEPKNDLMCHDAMVPQQDKVHLLQSCEEQLSFCRGIFDALVRLIGEVCELKHDKVMISKLWNFTKELKDQEKQLLFSSKIESLNSSKDTLYVDQTAELENLTKWYKAHQEQLSQLEKLLSTLLRQGKSTKSQETKTDPSQIPSELPNSSWPSISPPFCTQRTYIMDKDKKPEEGKPVRCSELRHYTLPSGRNPEQQNDETIELARPRLKTYPSEETLDAMNEKAD